MRHPPSLQFPSSADFAKKTAKTRFRMVSQHFSWPFRASRSASSMLAADEFRTPDLVYETSREQSSSIPSLRAIAASNSGEPLFQPGAGGRHVVRADVPR